MALVPKTDLESLKSVVLFFLAQREKRRPVGVLLSAIKDIRYVLFRMVKNELLPASRSRASAFMEEIDVFLDDLRNEIQDEISDVNYVEYVIDQIADSLRSSLKIKDLPAKTLRFKNIVEDMPILRPFDLNLRPQIKLVGREEKSNGSLA